MFCFDLFVCLFVCLFVLCLFVFVFAFVGFLFSCCFGFSLSILSIPHLNQLHVCFSATAFIFVLGSWHFACTHALEQQPNERRAKAEANNKQTNKHKNALTRRRQSESLTMHRGVWDHNNAWTQRGRQARQRQRQRQTDRQTETDKEREIHKHTNTHNTNATLKERLGPCLSQSVCLSMRV